MKIPVKKDSRRKMPAVPVKASPFFTHFSIFCKNARVRSSRG